MLHFQWRAQRALEARKGRTKKWIKVQNDSWYWGNLTVNLPWYIYGNENTLTLWNLISCFIMWGTRQVSKTNNCGTFRLTPEYGERHKCTVCTLLCVLYR